MTSTNSTLNIILSSSLAMSSSVTNFAYDKASEFHPHEYGVFEYCDEITDWNKNLHFTYVDSNVFDRYETLVSFSQKLLSKTVDLDEEFVDIVNDNFWDLI